MRKRYWFVINIPILFFICCYLFYNLYEEERNHKIMEISGHQKIQAKLAARSFSEQFEKIDQELAFLVKQPDIISLNNFGKAELTRIQRLLEHEIKSVTRTNKNGVIIFTTPLYPNSIGSDISNQKHMRKILADHKPVVSDVFNVIQGYQAIAVHYPIFKNGKYDGSLAYVLNFRAICNKVLNDVSIGKSGYAWMLSSEGTELYCPVPGHIGKSIYETAKNFPELLDLAKKMLAGKEGVATYSYNKIAAETKEVKKIAYYIPVKWNNTFWSVTVASSEDEIIGSLSGFAKKLIIVISVLFIGVILLSFFGLKVFFAIRESNARRIAEEELKKSEERYRMISTVASDYMYSSLINEKDELKLSWVAGAFEKITGYTFEEYIARGGWVACLHPDDIEKDQKDIEQLRKNLRVNTEIRTIAKNGSVVWVHVYAHPIWDNERNKLIGISGAVHDITKRKIAEEHVTRFSRIFEYNLSEILIFDGNNYRFIEANNAAQKNLGYSIEELRQITPFDIQKDINKEDFCNSAASLINGENEKQIFYTEHIRKDGSLYPVEIHLQYTIFDSKPVFTAFIIDITERKRAEEIVKENQEKFRIAFDNAPTGMSIISPNSTYVEVNPFLCKMFGYTKEELISGTINNITHPDDIEISRNWMIKKMSGDDSEPDFEKRYLHKDGNIVWGSVRAQWIRDAEGKPLVAVAHIMDITERKRAEEQLKTFQRATEQSPAAIVITDITGRIQYVNKMFSKISGYSAEEIINKPLRILNTSKNETNQSVWNHVKNGNEWKGEYFNKRKNGDFYWESTLISPIKDKDNNITHLIVVQEDITERKEFEKKLTQAKERAEEVNRLKSNFLANMSHELRTPLMGMMGFSELLYNELHGETKELVKMMNMSSRRLLSTLNTLLNYSKLESEKMQITLSSVHILDLIKEELKLFEVFAQQNGLQLLEKFQSSSIWVRTDERLFKEIIDNLLNNAIRFTREGSITVSVEKSAEELIIKVSDTGIGIPKEKLKTIFEEFRQVSKGLSRNFEGTGLGLTIVQKCVTALGGNINVESELGVGSVFTVTFPIDKIIPNTKVNYTEKIKVSETSIAAQSILSGNYSVLLVEDEELNAIVVRKMMGSQFVVDHVTNAKDALQKVNQKMYDVILMDINLKSDLSGIEAVKIIRKIDVYKKTPIVAMTAYAMQKDKEEFIANGCSHFIAKPFNKDRLMNLLYDILK